MSAGRIALVFSGVVLGFSGEITRAQDNSGKTIERLGYGFDQQMHDAAVAAEKLQTEPRDEETDEGDLIKLRRHYVVEKRMPFTERDILTPEGKVQVATRRHTSPVYRKTIGPLAAVASLLLNPLGGWNPNAPEAMTLYEDAERKRRKTEMRELQELDAGSDSR